MVTLIAFSQLMFQGGHFFQVEFERFSIDTHIEMHLNVLLTVLYCILNWNRLPLNILIFSPHLNGCSNYE